MSRNVLTNMSSSVFNTNFTFEQYSVIHFRAVMPAEIKAISVSRSTRPWNFKLAFVSQISVRIDVVSLDNILRKFKANRH
jgi:hypothetical protein